VDTAFLLAAILTAHLDADSFRVRIDAERGLRACGALAWPAATATAQSNSREASERAGRVLDTLNPWMEDGTVQGIKLEFGVGDYTYRTETHPWYRRTYPEPMGPPAPPEPQGDYEP
jgi:hypothetical protein